MVKRKQHEESLPFSSDDEINSDDFDSDFDGDSERFQHDSVKVTKKRNKYVTGLYTALGITDEEVQKLKDGPINTASKTLPLSSSSSSKPFRPPPEIIVFDDPSKRHKVDKTFSKFSKKEPEKSTRTNQENADKLDQFIDLNTARHEVKQFGIKGFEGAKKEDAILNMLVKLGAKPPKKTCINYKELQINKKKEKEESTTSTNRRQKIINQQQLEVRGSMRQIFKDKGLNRKGRKDAGETKRKSKNKEKSNGPAEKKRSGPSSGVQRISGRDLKMMRSKKHS